MDRQSILKQLFSLILAGLFSVAGCSAVVAERSGGAGLGEETAYLFSSFRGQREGLYLAWSEDLYHWTEIPGPHLKPAIGDNIMRDPFIMTGPDGTIHMVWTTGWGRRDIGYASTRDLINWSEQKLIPVMGRKPKAKNCWAPKIFYDEVEKQWQIIWSTWLDDGTFGPPEKPHTSKQHRIWYVTTKDFETFTEPKLLLEPGYSCIDAYLLKDDGQYLLFFKDERYNDSEVFTPAHQNIRMARSKSRYGPFGDISEPITGQGPGKWHNEGACAVKHQGEYYLFYDHHSGQTYFGATKSRDLKHWTDISDKINFPKGFKHGSIIKVPKRIVDTLLAPNSHANAHYSELLREALRKAGWYIGGYKLMTRHSSLPSRGVPPRFEPLVDGLDDANAVPFLLQVIYQGPPWEPSSKLRDRLTAYVARSYALLSLAASGDSRAFSILSDVLQNAADIADPNLPEVMKQKYDMRAYAAAAFGTLGDPNAVDLLLGTLDDPNPYVKEQTFWALAKIGEPRAIRPMLEQALADDEIRDMDFDSCMVIITKMEPEIDLSRERREITYRDFPELGPLKLGECTYKTFWQHWLTVGAQHAREHFEDECGKWKIEKKTRPPHEKRIDDRDKKKMLKYGVATLPFMIEQIRQSESDLIPLISELVDGRIPANAAPQQCLEWWDNNKNKWTLAFDEPITGRSPGKWHNEGPCVDKHQGEPFERYYELLGEVITQASRYRTGIRIVPPRSYSDPGWWNSVARPPEFHPIEGLDDVNAVPFLLEVIYSGPQWQRLNERYLIRSDAAKAYALLTLAAIGHPEAFGVLSDIVQNEPNSDVPLAHGRGVDDIRSYAVMGLGMLGEPNAIELLLQILDNGAVPVSVRSNAVWALARIGEPRTIKSVLEAALGDDKIIDQFVLDSCMRKLTKTKPEGDFSRETKELTFKDFPELGALNPKDGYKRLWEHWLTVGEQRARQHFEDEYGKWKIEKKTRLPHEKRIDGTYKKNMLKYGVATLPFMIEQVRQGESDLIPLISELVDGRIPANAAPQQCLEWWDNNKDRWTIAFVSPKGNGVSVSHAG